MARSERISGDVWECFLEKSCKIEHGRIQTFQTSEAFQALDISDILDYLIMDPLFQETTIYSLFPVSHPTEACDLHLRVGLRAAFLETIPCSASKGLS